MHFILSEISIIRKKLNPDLTDSLNQDERLDINERKIVKIVEQGAIAEVTLTVISRQDLSDCILISSKF